ncbi:MAG: hypothetical protein ABI039_10300, partial [Vicinamibacterales bacterium]
MCLVRREYVISASAPCRLRLTGRRCRYSIVRITLLSWLMVAAGGALFGAALIGVARILPTEPVPAHGMVTIDTGDRAVLTPVSRAPEAAADL